MISMKIIITILLSQSYSQTGFGQGWAGPAHQKSGPTLALPLDSVTTSTAMWGVKWKDPFQQIQDLTSLYAKSHVDSERLQAETKCQHVDTELQIQQLKNEEQECQQQHKLQIIDKILLAQLQASNMRAQASNADANMVFMQAPARELHR